MRTGSARWIGALLIGMAMAGLAGSLVAERISGHGDVVPNAVAAAVVIVLVMAGGGLLWLVRRHHAGEDRR